MKQNMKKGSHLCEHEILTPKQFGFVKNRSPTNCVAKLCSDPHSGKGELLDRRDIHRRSHDGIPFIIPSQCSSKYMNGFVYLSKMSWNCLSPETQSLPTIEAFTAHLKRMLTEDAIQFCFILTDCYTTVLSSDGMLAGCYTTVSYLLYFLLYNLYLCYTSIDC